MHVISFNWIIDYFLHKVNFCVINGEIYDFSEVFSIYSANLFFSVFRPFFSVIGIYSAFPNNCCVVCQYQTTLLTALSGTQIRRWNSRFTS